MFYIERHGLFFGSIAFGILLWVMSYFLLPFHVSEPFHVETSVFIVSCYLMLVLGFILVKPCSHVSEKNDQQIYSILNILVAIIIISYLLRWSDLFIIRDLSFTNEPKINRVLNRENSENSNLIFILASILKSLYFFPYVVSVKLKYKRNKPLKLLCLVCLFLPVLEAILKGTRKPLFEIFLIIILCTLVYNQKKITKIKITVTALVLTLLLTASMWIVFQRENLSENMDTEFYEKILKSRYNEILKPKPVVNSFFADDDVSLPVKFYAMAAMQMGQYVSHGVFEFNHIIRNQNLPISKGSYTFSTVPRFLNKLGIINNFEADNPSPREFVYLSAFGAMYIDFRWFSLLFMFILGMAQKYVFSKSISCFIYTPVVIYFSIINVFLPILNYIRGSGFYPLICTLMLIFFIFLYRKIFNEKSLNS